MPRLGVQASLLPEIHMRKIVFVGDEMVGKSAFLLSVQGIQHKEYLPTIEDTYEVETFENILFVDTAGSPAFDRFRPYSYESATDAVLCFALDSHDSVAQITEKWKPEVQYFIGKSIHLLGLKRDLRTIDRDQGLELAHLVGAIGYHECSSFDRQECLNVLRKIVASSGSDQKRVKSNYSSSFEDLDDAQLKAIENADNEDTDRTSTLSDDETLPSHSRQPSNSPADFENIHVAEPIEMAYPISKSQTLSRHSSMAAMSSSETQKAKRARRVLSITNLQSTHILGEPVEPHVSQASKPLSRHSSMAVISEHSVLDDNPLRSNPRPSQTALASQKPPHLSRHSSLASMDVSKSMNRLALDPTSEQKRKSGWSRLFKKDSTAGGTAGATGAKRTSKKGIFSRLFN